MMNNPVILAPEEWAEFSAELTKFRSRAAELEAENAALRRVPLSESQANKMYGKLQAAESRLEGVRRWINEERDSEHKRQCHAVVCENCARIICADELQAKLKGE
jgi:hypothetical protein